MTREEAMKRWPYLFKPEFQVRRDLAHELADGLDIVEIGTNGLETRCDGKHTAVEELRSFDPAKVKKPFALVILGIDIVGGDPAMNVARRLAQEAAVVIVEASRNYAIGVRQMADILSHAKGEETFRRELDLGGIPQGQRVIAVKKKVEQPSDAIPEPWPRPAAEPKRWTLEEAARFVQPPLEFAEADGLAQFKILKLAGVDPRHTLLEIGAGYLKLAKHLIGFLDVGAYSGIEPEEWLVEAGIAGLGLADLLAAKKPTILHRQDFTAGGAFDVIYAHSVLTHTSKKQSEKLINAIAAQLEPAGFALVSLNFGDDTRKSRWTYPAGVSIPREEFERLCLEAELLVEDRPDFTAIMKGAWKHTVHSWVILRRG